MRNRVRGSVRVFDHIWCLMLLLLIITQLTARMHCWGIHRRTHTQSEPQETSIRGRLRKDGGCVIWLSAGHKPVDHHEPIVIPLSHTRQYAHIPLWGMCLEHMGSRWGEGVTLSHTPVTVPMGAHTTPSASAYMFRETKSTPLLLHI